MAPAAPNLYAESVYRPRPEPDKPRKPNPGPFLVDVYEYPPTFLPLPRLMAAATPDFWQFRRLWFALNLAGVALCLVAIARRFDAALGTQAVWLTPWVLVSPSIVGTLQAGNAHVSAYDLVELDGGFHGSHLVARVDGKTGSITFNQIALFDQATSKVYAISIYCSTECYDKNESKIDSVIKSWTVKDK
jgi:hypothetical protein